MLSELADKCKRQGIVFSWSDRLSEKICLDAEKKNEGARPIAKLIDRNVRNIISDGIISGEFCPGDKLYADVFDNCYSVKKTGNCACYSR